MRVGKWIRIVGYAALAIVVAWLGLLLVFAFKSYRSHQKLGGAAPLLIQKSTSFRDLNKNGRLDVYEDPSRLVDQRVEDILDRMTLEEKAGMMFIAMIVVGSDGALAERPQCRDLQTFIMGLIFPSNSEFVAEKLMNHFNVVGIPSVREMALWNNTIQKLAERTRLGIPVTLASDPRSGFIEDPGRIRDEKFSRWCEPLGLAASRDTGLVKQYADIVRQEYLATGIRLALHPMADLATEPRWPRMAGTFGEDAELSSAMLHACIKGFQGDTLGPQSVACMTKHFSGGGPQMDGLDPHFAWGKDQIYPGRNFDYHLIPFEKGAFAAGTAQIMPYYGVPVGQTREDVGFAFNRDIIQGLLRKKYGFDGVVCSDWSILTDKGLFFQATSWGVEGLSPKQKILKALDAGIDQFGGEYAPDLIVELVQEGQLDEDRLDQSVRRLLRDKFSLGLFDDPWVDADRAEQIVGQPRFQKVADQAQARSMVLLKNGEIQGRPMLPLKGRPKAYIENIDPGVADKYVVVVETPEEADLAIMRLNCPFQPRYGILARYFHHGDLDFKEPEKTRILEILKKIPTVVDIQLDRAAVIPDLSEQSQALVANFGCEDRVLLDLLFGDYQPGGLLPVELPSSMKAVNEQLEDVPYDSQDPLYSFGFGLAYPEDAEAQLPTVEP